MTKARNPETLQAKTCSYSKARCLHFIENVLFLLRCKPPTLLEIKVCNFTKIEIFCRHLSRILSWFLINLLLIYKIYRTPFDDYFWRLHAVICRIENVTEAPDNLINDLGYFYVRYKSCLVARREKNNASSLIQINVKNDKTKTNGVEIIFYMKL